MARDSGSPVRGGLRRLRHRFVLAVRETVGMTVVIAPRGIPVPVVQGPDGRLFRGRYPHGLGSNGEAPFISALALKVGGIAEVMLPAGRADVATGSTVYEVEPIKHWRRGAQQAFAYAGMSGLRPALAVFGDAQAQEMLAIYLRVRDRMMPLELWVWNWCRWNRVTNRQTATRNVRCGQPTQEAQVR